MSLAVQECLSLMAAAYGGVQGQSALIIEALLLENIYSVWQKLTDMHCSSRTYSLSLSLSPSPISQADTQVRLAAVQYAMSVFGFDHIPSRFVCIIACGDG